MMSGTAVDQSRCSHCLRHIGTGGEPTCCKCGYSPPVRQTVDLVRAFYTDCTFYPSQLTFRLPRQYHDG